jgi:hypothetical protein
VAVLLLIKWLVITALILAVPFGIWWTIDRSRRQVAAAPMPAPPVMPARPMTPRPMTPRPVTPRPVTPRPVTPRLRPAAPRPPAPRRPITAEGPEPPTAPVPVPRAATPAPVLDADKDVVVTREEDHQDVLAGHHRPGATPTPLVVELWSSTVTRGKYQGDYAVEVRIDGRRVGELTAAMSARYRHLVDALGPVRCRGVVTHGRRGFQVDLKLPDVV